MRFSILVDGGFLVKTLRNHLPAKRVPTAEDLIAACQRIRSHPALEDHDLLRILFYDAPPASGSITNPLNGERVNLGRTP